MFEQLLWILVFVANLSIAGLVHRYTSIRSDVYGYLAIGVWCFVLTWLPITGQERISGDLRSALSIVGIFLVALFFYIGHLASHENRNWGFKRAPKLCTSGVYGVVRHPMYLGWILFYIGWSLIWGAIYSLYLAPIIMFIVYLQALYEENYMVGKDYGEEYEEYKRKVGMFMPKPERLRKTFRCNKSPKH